MRLLREHQEASVPRPGLPEEMQGTRSETETVAIQYNVSRNSAKERW